MPRCTAARGLAAAHVVVLLLFASPAHAQTTPPAQTPAVIVAPITSADVARSAQFIGTIEAIQSVDLTARVTGFLEAIEFKEGSIVKTGDVLYEIEKAPYQADLAAAEGQLAAAQASLAGAKAKLKNAQTELDRQLTLVQRGTVSQAVADNAQATRDQAAAEVQSAEASIKQAEAQIESAKLNLSYTEISAPITGQIGATAKTVGNLVGPDSGTLATIMQLDPIRVAFSVPEADYINFVEAEGSAANAVTSDTDPPLTPRLTLANRKPYEPAGEIAFTSNRISSQTGTLVIYADFPNKKEVLLPGGFVSVSVSEARARPLPVVPASAVLQDRQGRYVFVVTDDNRAAQRRIEIGPRVGQDYSVTSGLQEGETVIVQGLQKVVPGAVVKPETADTHASAEEAEAAAANSATPAAPQGATSDDGASATGAATAGPTGTTPADPDKTPRSAAPPQGTGTSPGTDAGDASSGNGSLDGASPSNASSGGGSAAAAAGN